MLRPGLGGQLRDRFRVTGIYDGVPVQARQRMALAGRRVAWRSSVVSVVALDRAGRLVSFSAHAWASGPVDILSRARAVVTSRSNRAVGRLSTLILAAAAFVIRFGCTYDPHFQSGVTRCAPASVAKRCPDGYTCVGELCVTAGLTGNGGGPGTGTGGDQATGAGGTAAGGSAGAGSGGVSGGGTGGKATGGTAGTVGGTGGTGTGGGVGTGGKAGTGGMGFGVGGMPGTGGMNVGGAGGSMTGTIVTFKIPTAGSHPSQITVGPDNNLWFVEAAASKIGRCTTGGTITEFATTTDSAGPGDIVSVGGFLWFIEGNVNKIGKCDTSGNMLAEFPIMVGPNSTVTFLAAGPDGNIWYTDASNDNIGRMTPMGMSTLFTAPQVSDPIRIAPGPDGNLWFTEFIGNRVSKITPTGTISRYTIMTSSAFPVAIASDKSAGLVFLEIGKVGRITTAGQVTGEYALPTGVSGIDQEGDVVLGPDGNFWFTNGAESIIRMTPTGTMTRYTVPGTGQRAGGMAVGPDGNLWFTDNAQNFVGRISP